MTQLMWSVPGFDIYSIHEGNDANTKKLDLLLLMVVCIDRAQTEGFPTKDALRSDMVTCPLIRLLFSQT